MVSAMALAGCAQEQESLIVSHVPIWPGAGECLADPSEATHYTRGTLDLAFTTPYMMPLVLQNQVLSKVPMTSNSGVDDGELQLIGADVTLRMPQSRAVLDRASAANENFVDFSVDLATSSLPSGGEQGVLVEVVSQPASAALAAAVRSELSEDARPTLLVDVVFRARRTGNKVGKVGEIEARVFTFPIQLCFNCLYTAIACPDGMPPQNDNGQILGGVCGNAQDFAVGPAVCGDPNAMN